MRRRTHGKSEAECVKVCPTLLRCIRSCVRERDRIQDQLTFILKVLLRKNFVENLYKVKLKMQSIVTFKKPVCNVSVPDWHACIFNLKQNAETRNNDAFNLRQEGRHLRNETRIATEWDTYHNDSRLENRVSEVTQWRNILQECLNAVEEEIKRMTDEKFKTERDLESVAASLSIVADCISQRDSRQGCDLVRDEVSTELENELELVESIKKMLTDACQKSWEQLNSLREMQFKLQLDLGNKIDALNIDEETLQLNRYSSGISFKPDPLRTPKSCIPYEAWRDHSQTNLQTANNEITTSQELREAMFIAREKHHNSIKAQHDATNYALRRRVHETKHARNELDWQRSKTLAEMNKVMKEIEDLEQALHDKTDVLKLAETRLENRMFRPEPELVEDEAQINLKEEVLHLRKTKQDLINKITNAKGTYNSLENHVVRLDADLANKNQALMIDHHCLEIRKQSEETDSLQIQTDRNIQLTRLEDAIPKS